MSKKTLNKRQRIEKQDRKIKSLQRIILIIIVFSLIISIIFLILIGGLQMGNFKCTKGSRGPVGPIGPNGTKGITGEKGIKGFDASKPIAPTLSVVRGSVNKLGKCKNIRKSGKHEPFSGQLYTKEIKLKRDESKCCDICYDDSGCKSWTLGVFNSKSNSTTCYIFPNAKFKQGTGKEGWTYGEI